MNLKQRILASILVIILALSLSGCGNKEKEKDTEKNGCLKVGEYEYNGELFSQTKDVCEDNGADVMYKAYEKLQKVIIYYCGGTEDEIDDNIYNVYDKKYYHIL